MSIFSRDKKLNDKMNRQIKIEKIVKENNKLNYKYLDNEQDGYMLPENPNEKTLKYSQDYLKKVLPKYNSDNIFDLSLPENGPFYIDYTRNGKYLLMGGEKGIISMLDWKEKNLILDFNVETKINSIKFLQNDTMFAVGQNDHLYIYDNQGIELHSLDYIPSPLFLEYLPYHFLLVSALKNNTIKYLDISLGKIVAESKTKSGIISSFAQNPYNAVIITGHSNGLLQMWTPNYGSTPVVKIFAHSSGINSCSFDLDGNYLTTVGNDTKMKIWDLRNSYKSLYEYYNPNPATCTAISQKGLLAVSYNNVIEIWKDYYLSKQKEPYMKHHFKNNKTKIKSLKFVNFEDFLGCGTNIGFSSIVIPGSGLANFDTFENNPYETKNQRKENEVRNLLEKIPYNMITLDPFKLNTIDPRSKKVIEKERIEMQKNRVEEILKNQKKKMKKRLKNKQNHDLILKEFDKNQKIRKKMQAMIELQYDKKQKEKSQIKRQVQILKDFADDFDPALYVNEKKEEENDNEEDYENDNDDDDKEDNI